MWGCWNPGHTRSVFGKPCADLQGFKAYLCDFRQRKAKHPFPFFRRSLKRSGRKEEAKVPTLPMHSCWHAWLALFPATLVHVHGSWRAWYMCLVHVHVPVPGACACAWCMCRAGCDLRRACACGCGCGALVAARQMVFRLRRAGRWWQGRRPSAAVGGHSPANVGACPPGCHTWRPHHSICYRDARVCASVWGVSALACVHAQRLDGWRDAFSSAYMAVRHGHSCGLYVIYPEVRTAVCWRAGCLRDSREGCLCIAVHCCALLPHAPAAPARPVQGVRARLRHLLRWAAQRLSKGPSGPGATHPAAHVQSV